MHVGAVHVHVELEFLADGLDVLEAFLVIGACAANPDLDLVLIQGRGEFSKGADDTLEC